MQRSHCGHQPDRTEFAPKVVDGLSSSVNIPDDMHHSPESEGCRDRVGLISIHSGLHDPKLRHNCTLVRRSRNARCRYAERALLDRESCSIPGGRNRGWSLTTLHPLVSKCMRTGKLSESVAVNEASEIALVRQAQRGDADAFSDLVRMYQRRAVSLAYRLLGNAEDAADVAQDAFVRAFRHLDQLADPGRFGPWLLRTVSNLSLNFRRSRASRAAMSLEDEAQLPDGARPTGRASGEASDAADLGPLPAELQSAVTQAVAQLPEKQRLSLILFSVEGMPQKEVAEVLECSIELVKWNVFQARKKLKELLAAHL